VQPVSHAESRRGANEVYDGHNVGFDRGEVKR
jgi:hypothetical protein